MSLRLFHRSLHCASGKPSKYPRLIRHDTQGNLSKDQCDKYRRSARKKVSSVTRAYYTCHAERWDDPDDESNRQRMREVKVGRVLFYVEANRKVYPDEEYLNRTHWANDLR